MKSKLTSIALLCLFGISVLSADSKIITNQSKLQLFPKVVQAGSKYLFTWCDNRSNDGNFEIYATVTNDTLYKGGSDNDLSTPDTARGHRLHVEMIPSIKASSNDTGAIVAWVDHYEQEVKAQRITSSAFAEWDNPVDVHDAAFMTPPEMCSDGAGGAIFTWVKDSLADHLGSENDTLHHFLRATRVDADGDIHTGWPVDIVHVTEYDDDCAPSMPRICADGEGGAMIGWAQAKPQGSQVPWRIYLCNVDSTGNKDDEVEVINSGPWQYYDDFSFQRWEGLNLTRAGDTTYLAMKYRYARKDTSKTEGRKIKVILEERNYVGVVVDGDSPDTLRLESYTYGSGDVDIDNPIDRECYSCLGTPVVVASSQGAYIAWSHGFWNQGSGTKSAASDIWAAKINSLGSFDFNPEQINSGGLTSNRAPQISSQDSTALVVWQNMDGEGQNSHLYKRKILSSGPEQASATSISNSTAFSFHLTGVDSDSAVVVWSYRQSNTDWDIYAKKFSF